MEEKDLDKLKNISQNLRKLNGKIKLVSLLDKANQEFSKNNYSDCQKTCKEILKKDSKNALALRGLGCVMQSLGNYKKAIFYYEKALENSQAKEIEYTLIGTVYYILEDLEKAIKFYNLAIDINDSYDNAYEGRNQSMLEYHLKIADLQDSLIKQKIF